MIAGKFVERETHSRYHRIKSRPARSEPVHLGNLGSSVRSATHLLATADHYEPASPVA
jgi:hypothetical protein